MKEPEKILEAKDICKAYGKNMVLNQVNLTIKAGEIYGLVGENGAGKSSLMKVITGLTKPTSGEISLFGKKNLEDERNKIGCLIENPALYMDMTARQNLEIQRTQRGIPGKSSIDEVLEIMDLKDAGNKRVYGSVQGVGFRYRTEHAAESVGATPLWNDSWEDALTQDAHYTDLNARYIAC